MALSAHPQGGEPFGRYRLIEQIGAGGMAAVYRAVTETATGPQSVVIKRVLPELSRDPVFVKMLVAEARLSSRLVHPGIVRVHELGCVNSEYFLAMEYVDGIDLVRLLNRCISVGTPLPIGLACHIAEKVASALAYAHDLADTEGRPLEIVHRDISPANIMVTTEGEVKLLDFGVAKAAEHVRDDRTRTGTLKGKINYLSPEQAEGLGIDRRSDLFALGIVLHESLTLKRLFRGESDLITLRMIRQCEVKPPSALRSDVTPELDAVVVKMLARDPAQRYGRGDEIAAALQPLQADRAQLKAFLQALGPVERSSVHAVGEKEPEVLELELEEMADGPTAISVPSSAPVPVPRPRRRRRDTALVAGAAALLLVIGALVLRASTGRPPIAVPPAVVQAPPPSTTPTPTAPAPAPKPGLLVVDVDGSSGGARLLLDGKVVANSTRRARLQVETPGEHTLRAIAPRRKPWTRTIVIAPGDEVAVRVTLEREHGNAHAPTATPAATTTTPKPRSSEDKDYLVDPFGKK